MQLTQLTQFTHVAHAAHAAHTAHPQISNKTSDMSDANSLPETLDGANVQLTAQTRQDDWPTNTTDGEFSSQHRVLLDKVDTIQATIDFIKITGGAFTGKLYLANGRACVSFTKFLINFRAVVFRAIAGLPSTMNAASLTEAIFYELRPGDVNTTYVTEFNQLVFDILMNACDEEALNIVLRYERSNNGSQQVKKDGRRALFALMQTYSPVSNECWQQCKGQARGDSVKAGQEHDQPTDH